MSANIPYPALKALHAIFITDKYKVLSDALGKDDTQNIWFELNADMRSFLQSLLDNQDATGIRLYFLQNPSPQEEIEGEIYPVNPLDEGQLTAGLVATKLSGGMQVDIESDIAPVNHGRLCPTTCV